MLFRSGQTETGKLWARRGAIWAAQLLVQLPVEVENPARSTPWMVYGLLLVLAAMFGLQLGGVIDLAQQSPIGPEIRDLTAAFGDPLNVWQI